MALDCEGPQMEAVVSGQNEWVRASVDVILAVP